MLVSNILGNTKTDKKLTNSARSMESQNRKKVVTMSFPTLEIFTMSAANF